MNIFKTFKTNQCFLFKKSKLNKILQTCWQHLSTDKASRDYFKSNDFTNKYSLLLSAINKPINLDTKDTSIIYLSDLLQAFCASIKRKGFDSDALLLLWRTHLPGNQAHYKEIDFLIKYLNSHANFTRSLIHLTKNIDKLNKKETAFILKAYVSLKDLTSEQEFNFDVQLQQALQINAQLQSFDIYDIKNVYIAYKLLMVNNELVKTTSQIVYEKLMHQSTVSKFPSKILNDSIYDKDLYLAYDFELKTFLWSRISLFSLYKSKFTSKDKINFLNKFLQEMMQLKDLSIPKMSFMVYKENLLAKFYQVCNQSLTQSELMQSTQQLEDNYKAFRRDFNVNLDLVDNYSLVQESIRLFQITAPDDDARRRIFNYFSKYYEKKLQASDELETYAFFQNLFLYQYLLSNSYLSKQEIANLKGNVIRNKKITDIYLYMIQEHTKTMSAADNTYAEIVNSFIKNLNKADYFSVAILKDTILFAYFLILANKTGPKTEELFIKSLYETINRFIDDEFFVKHYLPGLLAKLDYVNNITKTQENCYSFELCEKLKKSQVEFTRFEDYLQLILFLTSNRKFLSENFSFVYGMFKAKNLIRNQIELLLPVFVRLLKIVDYTVIMSHKKELVDLTSKFQTKLVASLQHKYFDKCDMSDRYNIEESVLTLCSLLQHLSDGFLNDKDGYAELRRSLTECLTAINVKEVIDKNQVHKAEAKKMKLSTRIAKLSTLILNTNCYLNNDLCEIWRYLVGYANAAMRRNVLLSFPSNANFIEILKLFTHYNVTHQSYFRESRELFQETMRNFYENNLEKDTLSVDSMLTYAEALLSLDCFDEGFLNMIRKRSFYERITNVNDLIRLAWIKQSLCIQHPDLVDEGFLKQLNKTVKLDYSEATYNRVKQGLIEVLRDEKLVKQYPIYEHGLTTKFEIALDNKDFVNPDSKTVKYRVPVVVIDHSMYHTNATNRSNKRVDCLVEHFLKLKYRVLVVPIVSIETKPDYLKFRLDKLKNDILQPV